MSTNDPTPHGTGEPARGAQGNPLSGNPYAQQQAAPPDLDAGAPQLRSSEMRRMNQRALLFLGGIVLLLLVLAYFLFLGGRTQKEKPKAQQETLTVPAAPTPILPAARPTAAMPVAAAPPLPALPLQAPPTAPIPVERAPARPAPPSLLSRRIEGDGGADASGQATPAAAAPVPVAPAGAGVSPDAMADAPTSAQPLIDPDTLMPRGTYIRCVLETHIVTDIPGFTSCVVTEPVYSFNGKHLLLPKGSKLLGKYNGAPTVDRVAVIWDRIITPNGIDVNMASPGVDDLGGAGHPGYYDAHWPNRIASAMLISMLSDAFSYEAAEHGPKTATVAGSGVVVETPFQSNTAQTAQQLASQAVRSSANRPATVTINQGTVLNVYVAHDVDFSGVVARL